MGSNNTTPRNHWVAESPHSKPEYSLPSRESVSQPGIEPSTYQFQGRHSTTKSNKGTSTIPVVVFNELVLLCRGPLRCRGVPPVLRDGRISLHNHIKLQIFPFIHFHCQALVCQFWGELGQQPDVGLICHQASVTMSPVFLRGLKVVTGPRLTDNQQVGCCTVLAGLIGANAGDVPSICQVHRRDGQNALDVQPILSLGDSPLLHCYPLRNS